MLSKRSEYALKALGYLAGKFGEGPQLISQISKSKKIPLKFLELILLDLKYAGIVDSKKGKGGGYFLLHHPKKTSIAEVIRIESGPIALLSCVSVNFYKKCKDCNEATCGLNKVMKATRDATLKVLEKKTIADLIDQ